MSQNSIASVGSSNGLKLGRQGKNPEASDDQNPRFPPA